MPGGGQVHVADDESGEQPGDQGVERGQEGQASQAGGRSGQRCAPHIMAPVITCKGQQDVEQLSRWPAARG